MVDPSEQARYYGHGKMYLGHGISVQQPLMSPRDTAVIHERKMKRIFSAHEEYVLFIWREGEKVILSLTILTDFKNLQQCE